MNDLIRPTLYEAYHEIQPVIEPSSKRPTPDGGRGRPVCESGDFLALGRDIVKPSRRSARGHDRRRLWAVQAGTYNTRALIPEVLVRDGEWALVRPRLEADQLIGLDSMPLGCERWLRLLAWVMADTASC
jgi:diaminopimelate decarboxylase